MTIRNDKEIAGYRLDRTVFTHTALLAVAESAVKQGSGDLDPDSCLVGLVFSAFALEAHLNYLGDCLIPYWSDIERVSIKNKLNLLTTLLKFTPDLGKRPYQCLHGLWGARNFLAHAKTEFLTATHDGPPPADIAYPKSFLESVCDPKQVKSIVADVRDIMLDLHKRSELHEGMPGMLGTRGGEILRKRPTAT